MLQVLAFYSLFKIFYDFWWNGFFTLLKVLSFIMTSDSIEYAFFARNYVKVLGLEQKANGFFDKKISFTLLKDIFPCLKKSCIFYKKIFFKNLKDLSSMLRYL